MSDPIVRSVTDKCCVYCPRKATLSLDSKPLCDYHAEITMTVACGRVVQKIVRSV